jgi:hypothetical protein
LSLSLPVNLFGHWIDGSALADLGDDGDENAQGNHARTPPGGRIVLLAEKQGRGDHSDRRCHVTDLTEQHRPTGLLQAEKHRKGHTGNQHLHQCRSGNYGDTLPFTPISTDLNLHTSFLVDHAFRGESIAPIFSNAIALHDLSMTGLGCRGLWT